MTDDLRALRQMQGKQGQKIAGILTQTGKDRTWVKGIEGRVDAVDAKLDRIIYGITLVLVSTLTFYIIIIVGYLMGAQ